jgi:hypothetical protein
MGSKKTHPDGRYERAHIPAESNQSRASIDRATPSVLRRMRSLQLAAGGKGPGQGRLVGELEIAAHGQALGDAADLDAHRLEKAG